MRFSHYLGTPLRYSRAFLGSRWFRLGMLLFAIPLSAMACGRRHHHDHNVTEAELKERAEDRIDHVVEWLDGTQAQKAQIKQILDAAIPDLLALRDEDRALRDEIQKELAAPDVNPAALESLRGRALKMVDDASARVLRALTDVAQVLTPEQRQKAVSKWKKFSS